MNDHKEQKFSFEEISGSAWWIHQISELPNWRHGGVFLLCTGPNSSVTPAGAWFLTATNLFTAQKEPLFSEVVLVVPPGTKHLNYRDQIKNGIKHSFEKSGGSIPKEISRYLNAVDWPLVQSDAESVLGNLQTLPEGSAVSITGAERLRFPNLEGRSGPFVATHTGQRVSHSSADDLMLPHLQELLRRLLKIAKDRRFSVVVFVENFDFEMEKLTEDIRVNPELAVMSVQYGDIVRSNFCTVIEALNISRTIGVEPAIQFIRNKIPDVSRQAHAVSFIYGDQGLWTEAWKILQDHVVVLKASKEAGVTLNLAQTAAGCGQGNSAKELLQDKVMQGLGVLIHLFTKEPDINGIGNALQCLNLACRIRREASWDFEAAIQLSGALASHGKVSDGLNLTENILIFWGDGSGEFGAARRSHAWSCKAEVYHRSRNPLAALFYLVLCFESMAAQPAGQHATLLKHKLRLATRILRDLNLAEIANSFLVAEAKLIQAYPRDREAHEWNVTEIGCRLRQINATTTQKDVNEILKRILVLLEDEQETEWGPPVSLGLSALSLLRQYGFQMEPRLVAQIQQRLHHCSVSSRKLFRYYQFDQPSVGDLQAATQDLLAGNVHDDEGFVFSTIEGLLRRAITKATSTGDSELFALAASWLSQPALAASRALRERRLNQPHAQVASLEELLALGTAFSPPQMRDYAIALQHQVEQMQSNFANLAGLPISAAKYVAAQDEALCLLAHDEKNNLCRLIIRRDAIEGPLVVPISNWNAQEYSAWKREYPRGYSWDRQYKQFGPCDTPTDEEISKSLHLLQPQLPADAETLTVMPEAEIFGFSYFLTNASNGLVGEATVCTTAPSLSWLAAVRQLSSPSLNLKAWLGHPGSTDFAVLRPRGELKPLLAAAGGVLLESTTPQHIGRSGVSVILSHGSQGAFGSFVGVNDVGRFTNDELARWLGESACVILFVCNAGRNDNRVFNQETFGIVGQLLRRGVRAVISPPAPLRNDLPALWFPSFYKELQQGKTVGLAYAAARDAIRQKFSHPCAWGALQLFGDAQLTFAL